MDIFDVAKAFLTISSMTQKKLQKLCYYAQGWYAGLTGEKLYQNELQAWIHGPVSPELYDAYKAYGYNEIPKINDAVTNVELKGLVEQIYRIYGKLDGDELETLTHKETPWKNARKDLDSWVPSNERIQFSDMQEYFSNKFKEKQVNA